MSTKIFSGTASTRALSWSELDDLLDAYSAIAESIARDHLTRVLAFKAAHLHDRRVLGLVVGAPGDAVIDVMLELMTKVTETIAGEKRNPPYDVGCEVWVGYDRVTERHLFNVFAELVALKEAWISITDVIVPFAYHDGDRPQEISDAEWAARGEAWERVTSRAGGIWAGNGYVRTVIGRYGWPDPPIDEGALLEAGPPLDERVQRASEAIARGSSSAPQRDEGESSITFYRRTVDWLRSSDGRAACESAAPHVRERLVSTRPFFRPPPAGATR